jgi:hypothetical protein
MPVGIYLGEEVWSLATAIVDQAVRLSWPAVAMILLLLVILSPRFTHGFSSIWKRTNSLKVGEIELGFTPEAAKDLNIATETSFATFRKQASLEITRRTRALDIRALLERLIQDDSLTGKRGREVAQLREVAGFRCTLYIRDVLFEDTLYQLVDYYPLDGRVTSGRTFSIRYGIIGRAWRMQEHLGEKNAQSSHDELVEQWGMTKEEAARITRQNPACICAILRGQATPSSVNPDGLPIALFFADSSEAGAFGEDENAVRLSEQIAKLAFESGLCSRLQDLRNELNRYSAEISTQN